MNRDEVFKSQQGSLADFRFNKQVAGVFDDMVNRSVPFYEEMQRMIAELAASHSNISGKIFDLGCSTGTTLRRMNLTVPAEVPFVGIDDSKDMLAKCRQNIEADNWTRPVELIVANINNEVLVEDASVVILCLTLQFVRPLNRERLIKQVFDGINPGGVMILVEKILAEDSEFNRDFINYYYDMKRRHEYSELEISQKREALENVLIPYKLSENITLLRNAGFEHCEVFFKWYNFAGIIAKKAL